MASSASGSASARHQLSETLGIRFFEKNGHHIEALSLLICITEIFQREIPLNI